jgi:hypothetical protein
MKVFISWSGPTSKTVAEMLRDWMPLVVAALEPWVSSEDISKGARWSSEISSALQLSNAGILCLTKDNTVAPWLMFEAGALSKTIDAARVCTYLFRMEPADLAHGPLTQFQHTRANRSDTLRLVKTLNLALGEGAFPDARIEKQFDAWWPELEGKLARIPEGYDNALPERSLGDKVDEMLLLLRDMTRDRTPPLQTEEITKLLLNTEASSDPLMRDAQIRAAFFKFLLQRGKDAPTVTPHAES